MLEIESMDMRSGFNIMSIHVSVSYTCAQRDANSLPFTLPVRHIAHCPLVPLLKGSDASKSQRCESLKPYLECRDTIDVVGRGIPLHNSMTIYATFTTEQSALRWIFFQITFLHQGRSLSNQQHCKALTPLRSSSKEDSPTGLLRSTSCLLV